MQFPKKLLVDLKKLNLTDFFHETFESDSKNETIVFGSYFFERPSFCANPSMSDLPKLTQDFHQFHLISAGIRIQLDVFLSNREKYNQPIIQ